METLRCFLSRSNRAQADGQRKELQRITADNKRLYRSLQVKNVFMRILFA